VSRSNVQTFKLSSGQKQENGIIGLCGKVFSVCGDLTATKSNRLTKNIEMCAFLKQILCITLASVFSVVNCSDSECAVNSNAVRHIENIGAE